jgi:hypothetical protein
LARKGRAEKMYMIWRRDFYNALYGSGFLKERNDMAIYCLIENRREFYNTRIVATHLMFKIKKKVNKLWPSSLEERNFVNEYAKCIKIAETKKDIINEKNEMTNLMIKAQDLSRWSSQLRMVFIEGTARNLMSGGRSVSVKGFDDGPIRKIIRDYKEGKGIFKNFKEL